MKRRAEVTATRPDPVRDAAALPAGYDGAYFVAAGGDLGQEHTPDIADWNSPPHNQPSLWCLWAPNESGTAIQWNEHEKFTNYDRWLVYLLKNFLQPWGYVLNGAIDFQGEDLEDYGRLVVTNNVLEVHRQEGPPNPRLRKFFEPMESDP